VRQWSCRRRSPIPGAPGVRGDRPDLGGSVYDPADVGRFPGFPTHKSGCPMLFPWVRVTSVTSSRSFAKG
jgi:hypothetical protein